MINRQFIVLIVVGVLALAGCAPVVPSEESVPPIPQPTSTEEPAASRPVSDFEIECSDVVSNDLVTQIGGPDAVAREPELIAGFGLERAAVVQDGGIICEWAPPDAAVHRVSVQVAALSAASGDIERVRPMLEASPHFYQTESGESATIMVGCMEDFQNPGTARCHWLAEQDGVLLEVFLPSVPSAENMFDGTPSVELVRGALSALVSSPRRERGDSSPARTCDEILPPASLETLVGTFFTAPRDRSLDGMLGISTSGWMTIALWSVAQERLGWTSCDVNLGSAASPETTDLAQVLDARGAAWIAEYAQLEPLGPFLEAAVSCGVDEGGEFCYVTAIRGDSVIRYTSRDSRTDLAEAILVATTS